MKWRSFGSIGRDFRRLYLGDENCGTECLGRLGETTERTTRGNIMAITFYAIGEIPKGQNFAVGTVRVKLFNELEEDGMTLERFATVVEGEGEFHYLNAGNREEDYLARECKYENGIFEVRNSQSSRIYKVRDDVAQAFAKSARISDGSLKTITNRKIEAKNLKIDSNIESARSQVEEVMNKKKRTVNFIEEVKV